MALRPDRKVIHDDINFKVAQVAEKGVVLVYDTANAGFLKIDQEPLADASLQNVAGMLMIDVVNKDFGAVPENHNKLETGLSGVVRVLKVGEITTNQVDAAADFGGAGSGVYLGRDGKITSVASGTRIGTTLGATDTDGYVKVFLNIV